jgi:formylmethanofuran dehydrogenase subunit E
MIPAGGLGEELQGERKGFRVWGIGCREQEAGSRNQDLGYRERSMPEPADCKHVKTRVIAKDQDAEYVECQECGEILEVGELPEPTGFDESLSDA